MKTMLKNYTQQLPWAALCFCCIFISSYSTVHFWPCLVTLVFLFCSVHHNHICRNWGFRAALGSVCVCVCVRVNSAQQKCGRCVCQYILVISKPEVSREVRKGGQSAYHSRSCFSLCVCVSLLYLSRACPTCAHTEFLLPKLKCALTCSVHSFVFFKTIPHQLAIHSKALLSPCIH